MCLPRREGEGLLLPFSLREKGPGDEGHIDVSASSEGNIRLVATKNARGCPARCVYRNVWLTHQGWVFNTSAGAYNAPLHRTSDVR